MNLLTHELCPFYNEYEDITLVTVIYEITKISFEIINQAIFKQELCKNKSIYSIHLHRCKHEYCITIYKYKENNIYYIACYNL